MYSLNLITRRGILVDVDQFTARQRGMKEVIDDLADKLRTYGYESDTKRNNPRAVFNRVMQLLEIPAVNKMPGVVILRDMLMYSLITLNKARSDVNFSETLSTEFESILRGGITFDKKGKPSLVNLLKLMGIESLMDTRKTIPYSKLMERMILLRTTTKMKPTAIMAMLGEEYNTNGGWEHEIVEGPDTYMQKHMAKLEALHGITFPRTDSGKIKVSSDDAWILTKKDIKDELLDTYFKYKHIEKMASTFLNEKHIKDGDRMHSRFTTIVRTGRTASSSPNIQNWPKGDRLREIFIAPRGYTMVSIDYSQLELCTLAQHCYTRFGVSRMLELINAGIDLHRWLAGRTAGIITDANDYIDGDEESVKKVNALLKKVTTKQRNDAKAASFGFPGGLGIEAFVRKAHKDGITDMTEAKAKKLKKSWLTAFPEMGPYMQPEACGLPTLEDSSHVYQAETLSGRIRRKCSFASACNYNFQGLAADGAKNALWELTKAGFTIVNFIHDEVLLEIPDNVLTERVHEAQAIMERAMKVYTPDVTIRTEAAAMDCWSKEAETVYDENNKLIKWKRNNNG